ncbi:MAG: AIR synthase family protein [Promethearchaeota archaeon]|nr:MAG: AIR synthase family protein [Candidatus Lokiarchaeota archaeon]
MRRVNEKFKLGKLKHDYLGQLLSEIEIQDNRVVLGSKIGEDAAVIDIPGENYLVVKTDPITFTTNEIGYYAVIVNVNDVVCLGAKPKWFQSTILLPENNTTTEIVEKIFNSINITCKSIGITVVGGHIEITPRLNRPIVIGSLIGEVEKNKLILTSGAEPGDALILTKGIFIEGTSIIGREKEKELKNKRFSNDFIEKCKNYLYSPGISVFKEALLANKNFKIKSCHDPTEGGVFTGIAEMTIASNTGVIIEEEKIFILPEPKILSEIFNLNPYNTISSGSLLIAVDQKDSSDLIDLLRKHDINAEKIGNFIPKNKGLIVKKKDGKKAPLKYSETDDITRIF